MDQLLKQEMENLKGEFGKLSTKMDTVISALMGNDLTKDGGLVGRIIDLEKSVAVMEEKIEKLENEKSKSEIYVKILWAAGGVVCTILLTILLNYIFKK